MASTESKPALARYDALDDASRAELAAAGYTPEWLLSVEPPIVTTVLNIHLAMRRAGLWRFVGAESSTSLGCLEFVATDVEGLKAALVANRGFTAPGGRGTPWQSRERRARFALHLKHFSGWPEGKVQAHIDPAGTHITPWGYLSLVYPCWVWLRHLIDYHGYLDVERIERGLTRERQP